MAYVINRALQQAAGQGQGSGQNGFCWLGKGFPEEKYIWVYPSDRVTACDIEAINLSYGTMGLKGILKQKYKCLSNKRRGHSETNCVGPRLKFHL